MGNHNSNDHNQNEPSIPGHADAEVEFEWKGVPHMKSSRSRTYWFDKHGVFKSHRARDEAERIVKEI